MTHGREFDKPAIYRIQVRGHLGQKWSDWFDGFTITPQANDETLLIGPVADQAGLHGLLAKIRDLGLPLLSVERVASKNINLLQRKLEGGETDMQSNKCREDLARSGRVGGRRHGEQECQSCD